MRRRWREPAAIAAEIDRIRSLRVDALRRQWRLLFGRVPPAGLSKDLLGRMMAARLQERAFGGLDRDSLRFLESLARPGRPPRRQLKPGTMLVREYQAGATSSRPSVTASSGRERHIPASQRSHAPSPARPGVGRASLPCKEPATAASARASQPPLPTMAGAARQLRAGPLPTAGSPPALPLSRVSRNSGSARLPRLFFELLLTTAIHRASGLTCGRHRHGDLTHHAFTP